MNSQVELHMHTSNFEIAALFLFRSIHKVKKVLGTVEGRRKR